MAELRPITESEVPAFRAGFLTAFGRDVDDEGDARFRRIMPVDRTIAAFAKGQMVGTLGDFPLLLTVPGGAQLSMGGTTMVSVAATHRRQGLLRDLMTAHMKNARDRGDALAGLYASEASIYGRFGFGVASERSEISFNSRLVELPPLPAGYVVELVPAEQVADMVAPFWSAHAAKRAGHIDRAAVRWENVVETGAKPDGPKTALRHIVVRGDGGAGPVVGYAHYRLASNWQDDVSEGSVTVNELMAETREAHQALWAYVSHIDLFPHVLLHMGAVDDPITWWASDLRQIRTKVCDALYLRILDVPAALSGRRYDIDDTVTFEVHDEMNFATGVFTLDVSGGEGTVRRSTAQPEVSLDVRELGSIYLGGFSASALWRAGRIAGEQAAVNRFDRLFRTHQPPFCSEDF